MVPGASFGIAAVLAVPLAPVLVPSLSDRTLVLIAACAVTGAAGAAVSYSLAAGSSSGQLQSILVLPSMAAEAVLLWQALRSGESAGRTWWFFVILALLAIVAGPLEARTGFAEAWKTGAGQAATGLAIGLVEAQTKSLAARSAVLLGLAVLNLAMSSRLLALVSILLFITSLLRTRPFAARSVLVRGLAALGALCIGAGAYVSGASSGALGAESQLKYLDQSRYGLTGFLLEARPEFVPSLALGAQHLAGVGSLENVTSADISAALLPSSAIVELSPADIEYLSSGGFHTHSLLLNGLVTGGVIVFLAWLTLVGILAYRMVGRLSGGSFGLAGAFWMLLALWEILFSPLTQLSFLIVPAGLAIAAGTKRKR